MTTQRICRACGEPKPPSAYYERQVRCKACLAAGQLEPPKTSAELIETGHLTPHEITLVDWCVQALHTFEGDMIGRLQKSARLERTRYRNQHSARRHFESPDDVLTQAGIPWRRQITLMSIAIAKAREYGLHLAYNTLSPLRRRIDAERKEQA